MSMSRQTHVLARIDDWIFSKFSASKQTLESGNFTFFTEIFNITIHPEGQGKEEAGFVSLFLSSKPSNASSPLNGRTSLVHLSFSIINMFSTKCNIYSVEIKNWKLGGINKQGCPKFISRIELKEKGLIFGDELKIRSEIRIFPDGLVKNTWETMLREGGDIEDNIYGKFGFDNFDLVVEVMNQEFKVHKVFLTAHSEVFAAMLKHDMKESSSNVVSIDDVKPTVFEEFLRFLYTKQVKKLTLTEYQELTACADKYSVLELKELCCDAIRRKVSRSNAIDLLIFAEKHDLPAFVTELVKFITSLIPSEITTEANWNRLSSHPQLLKEIICSLTSCTPKQ